MHIYQYIQHPCTTLHLTGRAPKPVKVNDGRVGLHEVLQIQQHLLAQDTALGRLIAAVCDDANGAGAAGAVGTPGGPVAAPGTAGA